MPIDHFTFDKCFRDSFQSLTRYAYIYVRDVEQSKEVVQSVFLKIWEKRASIHINTDLRVYLYQVVKNESLNFQRSQRRVQYTQAIPEVPSDEIEDVALPSPETIDQQIKNLPARCQEIFLLKKFHGLTYKQISARLNISEKSVENQMTIALKRLRTALIPFNDDKT